MDYTIWRSEVFGQTEGSDPVTLDNSTEFNQLSPDSHLDFIVRAMDDSTIHSEFSAEQIGIGIELIFNNSCSNIPFAYLQPGDDVKRVAAIEAIGQLYRNYFDRYCNEPVERIGYSFSGHLGYICYMFWDIFVVKPHQADATDRMIEESVRVMKCALGCNEQCQVSALHGLGHWVSRSDRAKEILDEFIDSARAKANPVIRAYAAQAKTGHIQ